MAQNYFRVKVFQQATGRTVVGRIARFDDADPGEIQRAWELVETAKKSVVVFRRIALPGPWDSLPVVGVCRPSDGLRFSRMGES